MAIKELGQSVADVSGPMTIGDSSTNAHAVRGTLQWKSEVDTPSTPISGEGGVVYCKADGKLYFLSNAVAEVELSSSGGAGGPAVSSKTSADSPVSAAVSDFLVCDASSGAITVNLPAVSGTTGGEIIDITAKDITNAISVAPNGSDTINGLNSALVLGEAYATVTLVSDGSAEWLIR